MSTGRGSRQRRRDHQCRKSAWRFDAGTPAQGHICAASASLHVSLHQRPLHLQSIWPCSSGLACKVAQDRAPDDFTEGCSDGSWPGAEYRELAASGRILLSRGSVGAKSRKLDRRLLRAAHERCTMRSTGATVAPKWRSRGTRAAPEWRGNQPKYTSPKHCMTRSTQASELDDASSFWNGEADAGGPQRIRSAGPPRELRNRLFTKARARNTTHRATP